MIEGTVEVLWGTGRVRLRRGEESFEMTDVEALAILAPLREAAEQAQADMARFVASFAPAEALEEAAP